MYGAISHYFVEVSGGIVIVCRRASVSALFACNQSLHRFATLFHTHIRSGIDRTASAREVPQPVAAHSTRPCGMISTLVHGLTLGVRFPKAKLNTASTAAELVEHHPGCARVHGVVPILLRNSGTIDE